MFKLKIILVKIFLIHFVFGNEKLCVFQENCEKCLTTDYNCGWCTDINFETGSRCMPYELLKITCSNIVVNEAQNFIVKNETVQDFQTKTRSAIQIQPQKIKMKLVKSHTERIKLTYRPAKNNPLDLYYLMDLTWSMKDDKQTLAQIGEQLAKALHNLTENYRIGYGSFADKPTMPMIMPQHKDNPCITERTVCEPTYGFRHHLELTSNIQDFIRKVNNSQVTANLDNLEGGLDALMQVLVCPQQIGWKDEARKIVILVTDGLLHFAGDGLLAGIVKRNDKRCHLNDKGEYTGTLEYDYPSLEEIYRELQKRKINVIFAVTENVRRDYDAVHNLMKELVAVEILSSDSSNILDLVNKGYLRFTKMVHLQDNSPRYITLTYETDCGEDEKSLEKKNSCENLKIGKNVDFYINVTLNDVPNDGIYNHIIRIENPGLSEYLELEVEIQQPCPCRDEIANTEDESPTCQYHGRFHCGMCFCDEGWGGRLCECDTRNYTSILALENNCRKPAEDASSSPVNSPICSGLGECECGKCYCNHGFTGKYCECPECSEDCNDRQECHCGKCICKYGWSGNQCNCAESTEGCISPKGDVCSGRGKCNCGACECERSYFGKFCEATVKYNNLCRYYEPCVKCLIEEIEDGSVCEDLSEICSNNDSVEFNYNFTSEAFDRDIYCVLPLATNDGYKCRHLYVYDIDYQGISYIQIKIDNCKPVNIAAVGMSIFAATIIFGFALMVACKTIVYFKDKAEYAKFEEQCKRSSLQENPIYKDPVTKYRVPKSSDNEEDGL